ncbi:CotH kinase family protein [Bacteroidota bacterium]
MKDLFIGFFIFLCHYNSYSQEVEKLSLNFDCVSNSAIDLQFNLIAKRGTINRVHESNARINIKNFTLTLNGDTLTVKSCHTRGKSTLKFPRKSLLLNFKGAHKFNDRKVSKCALNSMSMDKNYWRNRFSYLVLEEVGIFPLYNGYAEFQINGISQGVYLLIEKPDSYAKKNLKSPALIRRDYNGKFEIDYVEDDYDYLPGQLRETRKKLKELEGEALYEYLMRTVNLEQYFQWLAVNYILQNGDYTDEVFFYYDSSTNKFNLIPWDYDDVFSQMPHEGWDERNRRIQNPLVYSGEDDFDYRIDKDDFLYLKYLDEFGKTLDHFSLNFIKKTFDQVYVELCPFYQDDEIISQSQYDLAGLTNMDKLKSDMTKHYIRLLNRCTSLRDIVQTEKARFQQ